ncbi:MAG: hypothetical protein KQH83_02830 [Actinobacteria bacterium]|nr:hypothetical protein [Actinomycetota bacterium]
MGRRIAALLAVTLLAAACGTDASGTGEPGTVLLRYGYQPGDVIAYDLRQEVQVTIGDQGHTTTSALQTDGTATYTFSEGPVPDTVEMSLAGGLTVVSATVGIDDGEPVDAPAGTVMDLDLTVVVDPRGRVVSGTVGEYDLPPGLAELFSGAAGSGGQMFGPVLPEEPVAVGSTWTTTQRAQGLGMDFTTTIEGVVAAEETIDGRAVIRVETTTSMPAVEVDVIEMAAQLAADPEAYSRFFGEGFTAEDIRAAAAGLAMLEAAGAELTYVIEESTTTTTAWMDPATGDVVRMEVSMLVVAVMEGRGVPGEDDSTMDWEMRNHQVYTLAG